MEGPGPFKTFLFSFALENDPQCVDHDLEIKRQGDVLNVQEIEFASFDHFFHIFSISKLHHTPTREAGFYF